MTATLRRATWPGPPTLFGYRAARGPAASAIGARRAGARRRARRSIAAAATSACSCCSPRRSARSAALWLSGLAARAARAPIGALRAAALADRAAASASRRSTAQPPAEFVPVFTAFRRMARDLRASRAALEEAQRRTAAVLRNVASGVVAVDERRRVTLANPRADALLGRALPAGRAARRARRRRTLARARRAFLAGRQPTRRSSTLELRRPQLRARLTRLTPAARGGGAVLTLDDVTELARAQRVLAWGEMARQVAHEIKNPLTPIRLGVQHLRRALRDGRADFDAILEQNVDAHPRRDRPPRRDRARVQPLRHGARSSARRAEPTDVAAIVRDVVALETLGRGRGGVGAARWPTTPALALARGDELREVLLNLFENARLARRAAVTRRGVGATARRARGRASTSRTTASGIPADVLPRIFEPHFSTRTSGSGLGLAISRRLVEGWGGTITVASERGRGTRVTITLRAARATGASRARAAYPRGELRDRLPRAARHRAALSAPTPSADEPPARRAAPPIARDLPPHLAGGSCRRAGAGAPTGCARSTGTTRRSSTRSGARCRW